MDRFTVVTCGQVTKIIVFQNSYGTQQLLKFGAMQFIYYINRSIATKVDSTFFLKEDFITKSTKHNTKNCNYLQNIYKPTTTKISITVHHKQDIMKH